MDLNIPFSIYNPDIKNEIIIIPKNENNNSIYKPLEELKQLIL